MNVKKVKQNKTILKHKNIEIQLNNCFREKLKIIIIYAKYVLKKLL